MSKTSRARMETGSRKNTQIPYKVSKQKQSQRWASRSGEVISYRVGDPKPETPPPVRSRSSRELKK